MPENEFEKQVQQKMDELRFAPSAVVWTEVEKQITETKKRRRFLVWLLLFLAMGGAASFFIFKGQHATNVTDHPVAESIVINNSTNNKNNTDNTNNLPAAKDNTATAPSSKERTGSKLSAQPATNAVVTANATAKNSSGDAVAEVQKDLTATKKQVEKKSPAENNVQAATTGIRKSRTEKNSVADDNATTEAVNGMAVGKTAVSKKIKPVDNFSRSQKHGAEKITDQQLPNDEPAVVTAKGVTDKNKKRSVTEKTVTAQTAVVSAAETINKAAVNETMEETSLHPSFLYPFSAARVPVPSITADTMLLAMKDNQADSAAVAATKNNNKKKLIWGIEVAGGLSNTSKGLSVFTASPIRDANNYSFSQPSNNTSTGSGNTVSAASPTDVRPGTAFSAGVFISQPSKTSWRFSAGIHYSYASTRIAVGRKIDTASSVNQNGLDKSISSFYQPVTSSSSVSYTNYFHFIELSPGVEKQLGRKSRFSFNTGISISQLISSNALQYSVQKNIYYQDNSLINKTQLGLFAGLNYRLLQKSTTLTVGPQFNYGITNLFKNEGYGNRHLFYAGITARIFFHKK